MINKATRTSVTLIAKMWFFEHGRKFSFLSNEACQAIPLLDHLDKLMSDALYPEGLCCFKIVENSKRNVDVYDSKVSNSGDGGVKVALP